MQLGSLASRSTNSGHDSVRKGLIGSLSQSAAVAVMAWETSSLAVGHRTYLAAIFLLCAMNFARLVFCGARLFLSADRCEEPGRLWYRAYDSLTLGCAIGWASATLILHQLCGLADARTLFAFMLQGGVLAGSCLSLAPRPNLNRLFIAVIILPSVSALLATHGAYEPSIAFVFVLYFLFLQSHVTYQAALVASLTDKETQYRAFSNSSFEGVAISRNGVILEASESMLRIYGYARRDFIGNRIESIVSPGDRERVMGIVLKQSEEPYEAVFCRQDGSTFVGEAVGRRCTYNGEASRATCVRDITHRKAIEESLRASEAALRSRMFTAFASIPGIVWMLDGEGQVEFLNHNGIEYMGVDPARGGRVDWVQIIHPEDVGAAGLDWQKSLRTGTKCVTNFRLRRASDGAYRWHLAISSPARDAEGRILNWVGSCLDVDDKRKAEIEAEQALFREKAAIESTRLKSEFLANMSHEIRTPLNGILGASDMLAEQVSGDVAQKYTRMIQNSGNALMVIINDILDFSKIEAGQLRMETIEFNPTNVLKGQLELMAKRAEEKGLALRMDLDPALPRVLGGDPGRVGQVLLNLISNAIKFTETGTVAVAAGVLRQDAESVAVRFRVRDEGIGIDLAQRQRLFQPFMQADSSTARKFGGTGLGLSICKRLVEMMGGEIGVTSEPGRGSEFWFDLNFKVVGEARVRGFFPGAEYPIPSSRNEAVLQDPQIAADKVRASGYRILIAEDNSTNQTLVVANLEILGYCTGVASNGREALEALAREHFDLVLMDCQMPEMDGLAATLKIRELEQGTSRHIPVIALTANAMEEDRQRCLSAGMDDYMVKPFRRAILKAMLEQWLGTQTRGTQSQAA